MYNSRWQYCVLNHWPSVYSSICLSIDLFQTSPCSMFKCWVCQDKQHSVADCVRNPTHPDPPTPGSSPASLPVAGPVTTSNMSSVANYTRGPSSLSDAFRCTPTTPCSPEWNPVNAAAHLHLLGEALSLIGLHLKGTNVRTILLFWVFFFFTLLPEDFYWKMCIQMKYWLWCAIVNSAI